MAKASNTQIKDLAQIDLTAQSLEHLVWIYEASQAMSDAVWNVHDQPRIDIETPAGKWIKLYLDQLQYFQQAIVDEAISRPCPTNDAEDRYRNQIVIGFHSRLGESSEELTKLMLTLGHQDKQAA